MRRRLARELAIQCLYQIGMNEVTAQAAIEITIEEALNDNESELKINPEELSKNYVENLVEGTIQNQDEIDVILARFLQGWQLDRLSRVDREILRMAVFEMIYSSEATPPKVALNEAIELAKFFGTEDSGKFVNGVLGKLIHELPELKQKKKEEPTWNKM